MLWTPSVRPLPSSASVLPASGFQQVCAVPSPSTERCLLSRPFTNYDVENMRIKLFQEPSYLLAVRLENYTALENTDTLL